jgi:four helix bundle protein
MRDFRTLLVWQKATLLTDTTYKLIARFPPSEEFALVDQMRRAVQSIELNISEGCGCRGAAEFAKSLGIAMGSASEVENCLDISRRQNFGSQEMRQAANGLVIEVKKMLSALLRKVGVNRRRPKR